MKLKGYKTKDKLACILPLSCLMLTRREILLELKRIGVMKPSLLKSYVRDFEKYIGNYYGFRILKTKKDTQRA
jgi:hypothetical protein